MLHTKKPKNGLDIETIYLKYRKLMYKEIYSILYDNDLTEDVIHDSFVKIMKSSDNLSFESEASERAYVLTVCKNTALTLLRKRNRFAKEDISDFEEVIPDESCSPDDIVITKETSSIIVNCIMNMDIKYRSVFLMRKAHNYSFEEIGDLYGISYETAKKRYARAKAKIIESVKKEEKI
ncbi:MAG: RNA polymerase sigma factor [Clostridia bacterium]|nr:RNA polymerase sigma factor [Clostridia bacterium]